ncbi:hypothetical protein R1flu_017164 [Riccia fluitans]|uniref:Peroxidase n=1 Tax=Riccia fluitans TaxID=41844 RepID=A0ABD1XED9_9MARC
MASSRSNLCVLSMLLLLAAVCEARWPWASAPAPAPCAEGPAGPPKSVEAILSEDFYSYTCPQATDIVKKTILSILEENRNLAGGFLRLHFHDCWVNGCDGSLLINSTADNQAERDGFTNFLIRGIPEIDRIKEALEEVCPNTVSCADILALAARDATVGVGGPSWPVFLGRRDSRVSLALDADTNLPFPSLNFTELVENFARKDFSAREMNVLSGSHTIGRTHCNGIGPNLYNYTGIDDLTNPNLDPIFAMVLKKQCPKGNRTNIVDMDRTNNLFDTDYYKGVLSHKGVFISDLALIENTFGLGVVTELVASSSSFFQEFANAMVKMGNLTPLTGTEGEIRKHCQFVN